jgi:hypothetical protein
MKRIIATTALLCAFNVGLVATAKHIGDRSNNEILAFQGMQTNSEIMLVSAYFPGITHNLTQTENADEVHPTWSPDGELMAYSMTHQDDTPTAIYIHPVFKVASTQRLITPEEQEQLLNNSAMLHPSWSPDGRYMAFLSTPDIKTDLFIFDLETSLLSNITATLFEYDVIRYSWSQDSQHLVLGLSQPNIWAKAITIVDLDKEIYQERIITNCNALSQVTWLEESIQIGCHFSSGVVASHESIQLDAPLLVNYRRLLEYGDQRQLQYSAYQNWMAFVSSRGATAGNTFIHVKNSHTQRENRLQTGTFFNREPIWKP